MENYFRTSFEDVRIHADAGANQRVLNEGALAFTEGRNIYFSPRRYQPETAEGLGLLAHELTHVVQQRLGRFSTSSEGTAASYVELEREAERSAAGVHSSERADVRGRTRSSEQQRQEMPSLTAVREILSRGLHGAADWVVLQVRGSDSLIAALADLRDSLRGATVVRLSPDVAASIERSYLDLRAQAPSWLPVPEISLSGRPRVQAAGFLAISVAPILLLLAFLILILWIQAMQNLQVRRANDEAVRGVIEWIKRGLEPPVHLDNPPLVGPAPPVEAPPRSESGPRVAPRRDPQSSPEPDPSRQPRRGPGRTTDPFPPSVRRRCQETNPTFTNCDGPVDVYEAAAEFLELQNEHPNVDHRNLRECTRRTSFDGAVIRDCDFAPGESWHCSVVRDSFQKEVSIFKCSCCDEDGASSQVWRGAHWSPGR